MPKMSMTMTEGTFLTWHKAAGDRVRQGEVVCEVATDKVDMEVEATVDGTLTRLVAAPEDVIEVGEPIAYVASESADLLAGLLDTPEPTAGLRPPVQRYRKAPTEMRAAGDRPELSDPSGKVDTGGRRPSGPAAEPQGATTTPAAGAVPAAGATSAAAAVPPTGAAPTAGPGLVPAADAMPAVGAVPAAVPAARRLAAERGVDLATITPTGPWRTIRLSDVDGARPRSPHRRATIARRMAASAGIPQFVLYRDIDLEAAARTRGGQPWTAVLIKVFAAALRRHAELNATWVDGQPRQHEQIAVAIAVDTARGLLAPVIPDPDRHDLATLASQIADVVGRARAGRLELAELTTPATTTVSNLGGFEVDRFQALLTPPQATALAVGAVGPKVVPVPGGVGVRTRCTLGLTVDHRVADGAAGARLLTTFQQLIDGPLV